MVAWIPNLIQSCANQANFIRFTARRYEHLINAEDPPPSHETITSEIARVGLVGNCVWLVCPAAVSDYQVLRCKMSGNISKRALHLFASNIGVSKRSGW